MIKKKPKPSVSPKTAAAPVTYKSPPVNLSTPKSKELVSAPIDSQETMTKHDDSFETYLN